MFVFPYKMSERSETVKWVAIGWVTGRIFLFTTLLKPTLGPTHLYQMGSTRGCVPEDKVAKP
jgi:hypothetical protein